MVNCIGCFKTVSMNRTTTVSGIRVGWPDDGKIWVKEGDHWKCDKCAEENPVTV